MTSITQAERQKIKEAFHDIDRVQLSIALGCTRNVIDQYACAAKLVSARRARLIEAATKGKLPAYILRPDIFK